MVLPTTVILLFTALMAGAFAHITLDSGSHTSDPLSIAALTLCWFGGAVGTVSGLLISMSIGLRSHTFRKLHLIAIGIGIAASSGIVILGLPLLGAPAAIEVYAWDRIRTGPEKVNHA